jgi:hypothetical protein
MLKINKKIETILTTPENTKVVLKSLDKINLIVQDKINLLGILTNNNETLIKEFLTLKS